MFRKLFYLVPVFIVVGLVCPLAAQEVDMETGFASPAPVIDGEVDEIWADASTQYFVPLDDPADGSGSWKVLYDADNLYVIVDVTDDSLHNDSAGSWQDDSVEIYFDGGNTKLSTPLSGDDHQYTFGWTTDEIQGTNITGATEGMEQAQVTTDTGWRIEVKMPWLSIWGVVPQAGDLIGIDCYYNDDDDGGDSREGKMLSFSAIEGWNDASQWATAVLAAEPEPEPSTKIVYVDATEGETGNTMLATGEIFTATGGNDGTDGLWRPRAFGNSATIFEANGANNGNPNDEIVPRLNTTIEVPENNYDVYVYFWADSSGWCIKAALENMNQLPLFIANDPNGGATLAIAEDFEEPVPMLSEGNRTLWQAYLGNTGVTTSVSVYIDSDPRPAGVSSWNERTWYDGIGYKVAPGPVDPGTEGLVAHYAFENDANDSSVNGLNGTVVGDPTFVEGVEGMAMDFSGNDYVDCGGAAEFSFTEAMTVSTWVNIRSRTVAWMAMIAKGENAWRLGVNNETTGIHYAFTGGARGWQAANTATELPFNEWHHVAATYDTTVGAQVYIDGVLDASNPDLGGIVTNAFSLLIGDNPEATGRLFDGMLDEVMIYNRALSESEIRYLAGERLLVSVENSSFELPGTEKIKGWNGEGVAGTPAVDIPGWSSDTEVADSGVESDWPGSTEGVWAGFLMGADPSVWNLTGHIIASGEEFILKVDLQDNWTDGGVPEVTISLYYDDAGTRVTVASATVTPLDQAEGGWSEFSVSFAADDVPGSVGKLLGIEIDNVSATDSWIGMDNVRLVLN